MRIIVRAFNEDGYHKDILSMNEKQVIMNDIRVKEPMASLMSDLIGFGGQINITDFPEITRFEVVVKEVYN